LQQTNEVVGVAAALAEGSCKTSSDLILQRCIVSVPPVTVSGQDKWG